MLKDSKTIVVVRELQGDIKYRKNDNWDHIGAYEYDPEPGVHDQISFGQTFFRPFGICYDAKGNLFVSQPLRQCIRYLDFSQASPTVSLVCAPSGNLDMNVESNDLDSPYGIACDSVGNLIICDKYQHKIKKLVRTGYTAWNVVRLLWIGKKKHQPQECLLSLLPREIIFQVIRFLDAWSIYEYDHPTPKKPIEKDVKPKPKKRKTK